MTSRRPCPAAASREGGFTLIELLVVIGIIAVMLVALIPAVSSLSKSSGRKAAIGSLLGAIEQARANAIKTGKSSYLVFPTFTAGAPATLDRYHYKSFAIFEDDPAAAAAPKQLTKWQNLPTGVAFRANSLSSLADAATNTPALTFTFPPDANASATYHFIKFNGNGEVEAPLASPTISVFEGRVDGNTEVVTSARDASGAPAARESVRIARLTGRAEQIE